MSNEDEYFLFLKSNDSSGYFPSNSPGYFTVQLPEAIYFDDGIWYCALRAITCKLVVPADLYIFCDLIQHSYVLDRKLPILQNIPKQSMEQGTRIVENYDSTLCFRITRSIVSNITLYIRDENLAVPSFGSDPTTCTLQLFKR